MDAKRINMKTKTSQNKLHIKNLHRVAVVKTRPSQRAEKALLELEGLSRSLFENAKDMIVLADAETGIILDINMAGCRLLGLPKEKLIGKYQSILHPPELAAKYQQLFQEHVQKEVVITEDIIVQNADGVQIPMEFSPSVVKLAERTIIQGIFRDMTERIKMEKAIRESEQKFSKAFMLSPQEICITRLKDGNTVEINESFSRYSGFTREDIIGRTSTELGIWTKPGDRKKMTRILKEKGQVQNEEFEFRDKDGSIRTHLFSAGPINFNGEDCLISIMTDITERKRIENALINEAARRRVFIEQSRDGIAIFDYDGKVYEANQRFADMLGYTMEEARGLHVYDWDITATREQMLENIRAIDEKGANVETQHRRKDGTTYDADVSTNAAMIDGEKYYLSVVRDITERKRMEQALRESEANFSTAFQSLPEAVSIAAIKDAKYVAVNDSFVSLNGFSREEVIGQTAVDLNIWVNPDDHKRLKRLIDEHGHFKNEEFLLHTKSGEQRTVLLSAGNINFGGQPCIMIVRNDITERKQMENALRESEEKFSKAFHASPQQIIITRKRDNVTLDVNDSYSQVTGFTLEETIGKTADELGVWLTPEDNKRFKNNLQENGRIINEEFEFNNKEGGTHIELLSVEPITIGGEDCWISISTDITERKRVEIALIDEATRRRILIEQSSDGIVIIDQTGKVYEANQRFADMLGYTLEEVQQLYIFDWEFQYTREQLIEMIQTVDETGAHFESQHRRKDGTTYDVELSNNGAIFAGQKLIFCVCRDITERKQMEKSIKESEEKFSKAFHAIPDAVSVATLDDGVFFEVNDNFVSLNGYTREEIIGHSAKDLNIWVNPKDRHRIKQLMKDHGHFKNEEFLLRRKNGEQRTVLMSADTVDFGGKPCILTIGNDITERMQAERQLQQAMAKLEQSAAQLHATNKELESFSYSVSHDLRSPLRSIDGFSQALLEDYTSKLDEKGQDYLNRLRSASQKMGDLIDGLLKLSRLTRSEMHQEKVDLGILAEEIMNRLKETQPKRQVKFTVGKDLAADGDPQMIRALLENLLGNAWKFTAKTKGAEIELGQANNGAKKTFFIKDNGAGFDMAFKDKLFGAFQRLHDSTEFPGTGIGLATVQRIVNRHGGTVSAEGEVNKGATFYFSLS